MKKVDHVRQLFRLLVAATIVFVSGSVNAAVFMEIPGIPGESRDANHDGWIDVLSTSGTFTPNSCGDFVVTKEIDKAFPLLVSSVVSGKVFSEIVVEYTSNYGGSRVTYSTITLAGATITGILTAASGDEVPPAESLTIQASSIVIEYTEFSSDGSNLSTFVETVICGKSKKK